MVFVGLLVGLLASLLVDFDPRRRSVSPLVDFDSRRRSVSPLVDFDPRRPRRSKSSSVFGLLLSSIAVLVDLRLLLTSISTLVGLVDRGPPPPQAFPVVDFGLCRPSASPLVNFGPLWSSAPPLVNLGFACRRSGSFLESKLWRSKQSIAELKTKPQLPKAHRARMTPLPTQQINKSYQIPSNPFKSRLYR